MSHEPASGKKLLWKRPLWVLMLTGQRFLRLWPESTHWISFKPAFVLNQAKKWGSAWSPHCTDEHFWNEGTSVCWSCPVAAGSLTDWLTDCWSHQLPHSTGQSLLRILVGAEEKTPFPPLLMCPRSLSTSEGADLTARLSCPRLFGEETGGGRGQRWGGGTFHRPNTAEKIHWRTPPPPPPPPNLQLSGVKAEHSATLGSNFAS